jgi:Tfp pilus assembly protein PilF
MTTAYATTTVRWKVIGIVATLAVMLSIPLYLWRIDHQLTDPPAEEAAAAFAGNQKCAQCHKVQYDRWKGSHHDLAMDVATESSVLGDFDDAVFDYFGIQSRFYRKEGGFWVHTRGPDGVMGDFEVKYVFGVYPLQQYLIPFPGGRLQCLPITWDVDRRQWYHQVPDAPRDPQDWLYWTNAGQNWNGMCAECHSTNLKKNYDPEADTYATTWSEIDVSCEACHGPGSRHVAWAELPAMARPQTHTNFELAVKTRDLSSRDQVELCAPCHSRRAILGDYTHTEADLLDSLLPTLLNENLYFPDGQILDEVYVYGSFTQSKMYHRQVRCGDCHDVHSLKTVAQGNALCLQCHPAAVYDRQSHHFHKQAGEVGEPIRAKDGGLLFDVGSGAQCVQCHMPGRDYMGIDYRPDHSFRTPRPDLSSALGAPNACNRCHRDKSAAWADEVITKWYGPGRSEHYGSLLAAGRQGQPGAAEGLIRLAGDPLAPVIVRATALGLLGQYPGEAAWTAWTRAAGDPEALIRHTAVSQFHRLPPDRRQKLLVELLYDPVSAVRMEAANQLSATANPLLTDEQDRVYRINLDAYIEAMTYSADFSFGRFNLGNLYRNQERADAAVAQYRAALKIDNQFYPAMVNLAMLANQQGDKALAEKQFRDALAVNAGLNEVHYSLGLLLAEMQRYPEAADHLERAAEGMPTYARVHYNLGQILDFLGQVHRAREALERAYALEPQHPDYLKALIQSHVQHQRLDALDALADGLLSQDPDSSAGRQIRRFVHDAMNKRK